LVQREHQPTGRNHVFSTGVSVVAEASDWAAGMKRADERLYDAKREAGAGQL